MGLCILYTRWLFGYKERLSLVFSLVYCYSSIDLYVCLFVCLSVCPSVCLSASLSVCMSVWSRPDCLWLFLSVFLLFYNGNRLKLSIGLSICRIQYHWVQYLWLYKYFMFLDLFFGAEPNFSFPISVLERTNLETWNTYTITNTELKDIESDRCSIWLIALIDFRYKIREKRTETVINNPAETRQTCRQTDRHTDRQTERQTNRHTYRSILG